LSCTGIAIYDLEQREFVFIGSFSTEKIKKQKNRYHNSLKLKEKADWVISLIRQYPPYYVAIERGFSRFNNATQNIFRVHGLVNYLFWDIPTKYYPPKSVKEKLVHGNATKEDLQNVISAKYNYIFSNEDESDAFAVALTALVDNELLEWVKPDWNDIRMLRKPKKSKTTKKKTTKAKKAEQELVDIRIFCTTFCPSYLDKGELAMKTKFTKTELYKAYSEEVINVLIEEYNIKKTKAKKLLSKQGLRKEFMSNWRDFEFTEPSEVARVIVERDKEERGDSNV
jgi:Holliday junction resolvasome RuvABC endonuclease subunit